jgi:hypothetical protein
MWVSVFERTHQLAHLDQMAVRVAHVASDLDAAVDRRKQLSGGHRFTFTPVGSDTRIDHELEMTPKGVFKLMSPIIGLVGRKNLRATAEALKRLLESGRP